MVKSYHNMSHTCTKHPKVINKQAIQTSSHAPTHAPIKANIGDIVELTNQNEK